MTNLKTSWRPGERYTADAANAVAARVNQHSASIDSIGEQIADSVDAAASTQLPPLVDAGVAEAVAAEDIPGQVASAVAADSTVAAAAAAAVTADIAGRDLVEQHPIEDPANALLETDESGRVSRYVDVHGRTWIKPHPDLQIAAVNLGDDVPLPVTADTDGSVVWAVTDENDTAAIAIHPDGSTTIRPSRQTRRNFVLPEVVSRPEWASLKYDFNPEKALYNFKPTNMRKWFAAFARASAGEGTAHVTTFVDSETYGASGSVPWNNSWPGRLRRLLDTATGYASGTGIAVPWNIVFTSPAQDPRWTFGAGATQLSGLGSTDTPWAGILGKGAVRLTNNTGNGYLTFTPVGSVDRFVIYALADTGATGTATVKIDGSSVGTFDVSAAGGGGTLTRHAGLGAKIIVVDVTGLALGTHTIRIEGPAASTVTIWGVEGGTGKGVRVSNLARGGSNTAFLTLDDPTNNTVGMGLGIDTAQADLVLLMLGLNDRPKDSVTFKAQTRTAIDRILTAGGDVMLIGPGQHDPDTDEEGINPQYSLIPRLVDMYAIADEYDIPLLDLTWVRKDWATAWDLGLLVDYIHSSNIGLEHHARYIFNALTGV